MGCSTLKDDHPVFKNERKRLISEPGMTYQIIDAVWEMEASARNLYADLVLEKHQCPFSLREFLTVYEVFYCEALYLPDVYALDTLHRIGLIADSSLSFDDFEFEPSPTFLRRVISEWCRSFRAIKPYGRPTQSASLFVYNRVRLKDRCFIEREGKFKKSIALKDLISKRIQSHYIKMVDPALLKSLSFQSARDLVRMEERYLSSEGMRQGPKELWRIRRSEMLTGYGPLPLVPQYLMVGKDDQLAFSYPTIMRFETLYDIKVTLDELFSKPGYAVTDNCFLKLAFQSLLRLDLGDAESADLSEIKRSLENEYEKLCVALTEGSCEENQDKQQKFIRYKIQMLNARLLALEEQGEAAWDAYLAAMRP